jgi:hypothetical protein
MVGFPQKFWIFLFCIFRRRSTLGSGRKGDLGWGRARRFRAARSFCHARRGRFRARRFCRDRRGRVRWVIVGKHGFLAVARRSYRFLGVVSMCTCRPGLGSGRGGGLSSGLARNRGRRDQRKRHRHREHGAPAQRARCLPDQPTSVCCFGSVRDHPGRYLSRCWCVSPESRRSAMRSSDGVSTASSVDQIAAPPPWLPVTSSLPAMSNAAL